MLPFAPEGDGHPGSTWVEQAAKYILISFLVLLVIALLVVALQSFGAFDFPIISRLSGLSGAGEVLKFLGLGLGGVVLMLQALIANRRARAMEENAKAQAEAAEALAAANRHTEEGQRQERLKSAIEHLGNDSESVRLGGAYELFHLARDTESLRQAVLDILCSHIRRTTGEGDYRKRHASEPSVEIQSLLTLLFVQDHEVFGHLPINLYKSWLNGVDLLEARLRDLDLRYASLSKALLGSSLLDRADFSAACLDGASLHGACLRRAHLISVSMGGANLTNALLHGADITSGHLTGVCLHGACLQGADLLVAHMHGADLRAAFLQGARIAGTELQGAFLDGSDLRGVGTDFGVNSPFFSDRIRAAIDRESDVSGVVDRGLTRERVEELVAEGRYSPHIAVLRSRLEPYIDKPDRLGLPEDHGARLGSFTREVAEEWIAKH